MDSAISAVSPAFLADCGAFAAAVGGAGVGSALLCWCLGLVCGIPSRIFERT